MSDERWENPEGPIAPDKPQPGSFDNYAMKVDKAGWVTDPAYNQGKTVLLEFKGRSPELPPEYADRSVRIPAGNNVKIDPDDPDHIVKTDGGTITQFHPRSLISKLVGRALDEWGLKDELKNSNKWFDQASIWEEYVFRFTKEKFEFSGNPPIVTERVFPTEHLGHGDILPAATAGGTSPDDLDDKLRTLYDQAASHEMFVTFATQLPEVMNDADILKAVTNADEALKRWGSEEQAEEETDSGGLVVDEEATV